MFDVLLVRCHGNRKNNDSEYKENVAYIFYTELIHEGTKSNPYGIKQILYQIEKPFKRKMEFLRECIAEMNGVGEYL